jgi:hypothetical protein
MVCKNFEKTFSLFIVFEWLNVSGEKQVCFFEETYRCHIAIPGRREFSVAYHTQFDSSSQSEILSNYNHSFSGSII